MKLAVFCFTTVNRNFMYHYLSMYLPDNVEEIIHCGVKGTDEIAKKVAINKKLKLTLFITKYTILKKLMLRQIIEIADCSDEAFIFFDSKSKKTKHIINYLKNINRNFRLIYII